MDFTEKLNFTLERVENIVWKENKSGKLSQDMPVPLLVVERGNNNRKGKEDEISSAAEIVYMIEVGMNI